MYWIIDDLYSKQREAFICNSDELNSLSYSGYYSVTTFDSYSKAADFCNSWNEGAEPCFMNITLNGIAIKTIDTTTIELVNGDRYKI